MYESGELAQTLGVEAAGGARGGAGAAEPPAPAPMGIENRLRLTAPATARRRELTSLGGVSVTERDAAPLRWDGARLHDPRPDRCSRVEELVLELRGAADTAEAIRRLACAARR